MENTEQGQTRIHQPNGDPAVSKMMIAMFTPEILSNILSFLDPPSLQACLRVSHLWRACSRPIVWEIQTFSELQTLSLFGGPMVRDNGDLGIGNNNRMQNIIENCHRIRSLTIQDGASLPSSLTLQHRTTRLRNLVHLAVRLCVDTIAVTSEELAEHYRLVGLILSHNPRIRDFEWTMSHSCKGHDVVDMVLKHISKGLRRLSISGGHQCCYRRILEHLINAKETWDRDRQRKRLEGESLLNARDDELQGDGDSGGGMGGCDLEELCLRGNGSTKGWTTLNKIPGTLPIRALTLTSLIATGYQERADSLLTVLHKCPNLERLYISQIASATIPPAHWFYESLMSYRFYRSDPLKVRLIVQDDFVDQMHQSCPRLRRIEFGLAYQFGAKHWIDMMNKYGPQLESLAIWGNLPYFDTAAFTTLIGPPVSHPSGHGRLHRLTRLNINGMDHLRYCAWMALKHLPQLKEFKAQCVPLDGRRLIMKDGWACKGLQVLEINILIPKDPPEGPSDDLTEGSWRWCNSRGHWTEGAVCCQEDDEMDNCDSDKSGSVDQPSENVGLLAERQETHDNGAPDETTTDSFCAKQPRKDDSSLQPHAFQQEDSQNKFGVQNQMEICRMLSQLTQLRELRIEGERDSTYYGTRWDCLELTLGSGLDLLAPLGRCLEKLDVYKLQEKLGGKEEMEWIARNWIHCNSRHSLEQDISTSTEPSTGEVDYDGRLAPSTVFKSLVGIFKRDEGQHIEWLKEKCPSLTVVVAERRPY
ncbi:hypothetical protein B0O80DRAFT_465337 [Mortierella sp. GBAus27b]|nr:hypothetical protein BGX31_007077 [Mortierella sp. GBA43]KAI8347533.1 hypothetical protein B0O80DRAFT_465337 [Mortierella sp. GBAus27b]